MTGNPLEFEPPPSKFGGLVTQDGSTARYVGGGTLRAATSAEVFMSGWEPMAVPVWREVVAALVSGVPSHLLDEVVVRRTERVKMAPEWDTHWICHANDFGTYATHEAFCTPPSLQTTVAVSGEDSAPATQPVIASTETGNERWVSGNDITMHEVITRRQRVAIMRDRDDDGQLFRRLSDAKLVGYKHDDPEKKQLMFWNGRQADWDHYLGSDPMIPVRKRRPGR